MKRFTAILVLAFACTFLFGGVMHAAIPHDHENESVWQELHAALRHEDKNAYAALIVGSWVMVIVALLAVFVPTLAPVFALPHSSPRRRLLFRGIEKYRHFS